MFLCSERHTRDVGRTRELFENHEPVFLSEHRNMEKRFLKLN
jgi:hypothetical protein